MLVARIVLGATGLLLCYGALFLYENEQKVVQSHLENLWIRVDDLQRKAVAGHLGLLRVAAYAADTFITRLFGPTLASARAVSVATCLSLVSLLLVGHVAFEAFLAAVNSKTMAVPQSRLLAAIVFALILSDPMLAGTIKPVSWAPFGLATVAILAVTAQSISRRWERMPMLVIVAFLALTTLSAAESPPQLEPHTIAVISLGLGATFNIVAVATLRRLLSYQLRVNSAAAILGAAALQTGLAISLLLGPLLLASLTFQLGSEAVNIVFGAVLTLTTNVAAAIIALAFVFAVATLAIHKLVWPLVVRPLYQLARLRVFSSASTRMALLVVGTTFVSAAAGKPADIFASLLRLLKAA